MQRWFNIQKSINVTSHTNGLKDKIHLIIARETEKKLLIKVLENVELEGTKLNIIKAMYNKTLCQHHPKRRIEAIPLKSRMRQECPLAPLYIPCLWFGRIKIVKMIIFL